MVVRRRAVRACPRVLGGEEQEQEQQEEQQQQGPQTRRPEKRPETYTGNRNTTKPNRPPQNTKTKRQHLQ